MSAEIERAPRWAVIASGSKQYVVRVGEEHDVEQSVFRSMIAECDKKGRRVVEFTRLLAIGMADDELLLGNELLQAYVSAELVEELRTPKVIVFKKNRRHNHRRRRGHRQSCHRIRILSIHLSRNSFTFVEPLGTAEPIHVLSGPKTAHEDLIFTLEQLREESVARFPIESLQRIGVTDWREVPGWAREEVLRALEWHLNADSMEVRAVAARALDHVLQGKPDNMRSWGAISETVRRHLIARNQPIMEFSLNRWQADKGRDAHKYTACVRIRKAIKLPEGHYVDLESLVDQSLSAKLEVKGVGVVPGKTKRRPTAELDRRIAAETALSFQRLEAGASVAVVDVYVAGRRTDRRFLDLENERVTRLEPLFETDMPPQKESASD